MISFSTDRKGTQASAILSTIRLMPTRSLLILVGYSVICYSAAGTHPFFLSFFLRDYLRNIFKSEYRKRDNKCSSTNNNRKAVSQFHMESCSTDFPSKFSDN